MTIEERGVEPLIPQTWTAYMPLLLLAWKDGESDEVKARAFAQLQKMARAADLYNEMADKGDAE